jgi:hypothetical protein
LLVAAFGVESWRTRETPPLLPLADAQTATAVGAALSGVRVDKLNLAAEDPRQGGLSGYLLPFLIVSVHLLVVLIGAAYMARTKVVARGAAGRVPASPDRPESEVSVAS